MRKYYCFLGLVRFNKVFGRFILRNMYSEIITSYSWRDLLLFYQLPSVQNFYKVINTDSIREPLNLTGSLEDTVFVLGPSDSALTNDELKILQSSSHVVVFNGFTHGLDKLLSRKKLISYWSKERFVENGFDLLSENGMTNVVRDKDLKLQMSTNIEGLCVRIEHGILRNPNLLPLCLYDLRMRGFSNIYIAKADLMVSTLRAKDYYTERILERVRESASEKSRNFLRHDPLEQFNLLKDFRKNEDVVFNISLDKILQNGWREYIVLLEEIYR